MMSYPTLEVMTNEKAEEEKEGGSHSWKLFVVVVLGIRNGPIDMSLPAKYHTLFSANFDPKWRGLSVKLLSKAGNPRPL